MKSRSAPLRNEQERLRHYTKQLQKHCNKTLAGFRFQRVQTWEHLGLAMREWRKEITDSEILSVFGSEKTGRFTFKELEDAVSRWYAHEEAIIYRPLKDIGCVALERSYKHTSLYVFIARELPTYTPEPPQELTEAYIPPINPECDVKLRPFQERAANDIYTKLFRDRHFSVMLEAPTGTGKTFIGGRVARAIIDSGYLSNTVSPWPILYVTKCSIVEQTERVLRDRFGIDIVNTVHVINIEQLRCALGDIFVKEETRIVGGEPVVAYNWRKIIHPLVILWDECHILKNSDSTQSLIAQAFQELLQLCDNPIIKQIFMSATPFMNVAETKVFTLSTGVSFLEFAGQKLRLKAQDFHAWACRIAAPHHPLEFSPAAMERYMKVMNKYVVTVKGVRPQFKARNSVMLIEFRSNKGRLFYDKAWDRYCEKCAKINKEVPGGHFQLLVELNKFREAAEYVHAMEHGADDAHEIVQQGFAAVIAVSFKATIARITADLINKHGYNRDDISLIWGGDASLTQNIISEEEARKLMFKLSTTGTASPGELKKLERWLEFRDSTDDEQEELLRTKDLYSKLGLGPQSLKERQREIDRFQSGRSKICIFTFKSGGVGLSLHHCDELTKEKAELQPNGWYKPETISRVPTRPRVTRVFPTYSAIELAQGFGRAARLTSMSDTYQCVMGYRGTVEVSVLQRVSQKLKCLKKVVASAEAFDGAIYEAAKNKQLTFDDTAIDTNIYEGEETDEDN